MTFRTGRRLGVDWGDVRIGVAACDPAGTMAFPVLTVAGGPDEIAALVVVVAEYEPIEVVVGLPRSLNGTEGPAAVKVRGRAAELAAALVAASRSGGGAGPADTPVPIRLVDERLSTVQAARQLRHSGKRAREQRQLIDQAAAREILDHALESERRQGTPPGEVLSPG